MKSLKLFSTWSQPDTATRYVRHFIIDGKPLYIRAEIFNGGIDEALDRANPREGETVLNTIPIQ